MSTHHTSKQLQCDCLILAQKVNKNMQIKGLTEFYLFQVKYCVIVVCLILFCMLSFISLSSQRNVSILSGDTLFICLGYKAEIKIFNILFQ